MALTISGTNCCSLARLIGIAATILGLSACATTSARISADQRTADIQTLHQAQREDLNLANNPNIPATAQGDFYAQATRASELLAQLQEARNQADRGTSDYGDDPILTEDFIQQENRIDEVTKDLENGKHIRQADLEAAVRSPGFP